jgi:hypothetical protein
VKGERVKCWYCELEALSGHLTCGNASCNEATARAEAHSARRGHAIVRGRPGRRELEAIEPVKDMAIVRGVCGASNAHMTIRCGREPLHEGLHVSGRLGWTGDGRPRQLEDDDLAALGPVKPQADAERLAALTQVLLTVRSQMLGLGTGLRKALDEMPRAVDKRAVVGLVGALSHIVQTLDSHIVSEGETAVRKGIRLGVDQITEGQFESEREKRTSARQFSDDEHARLEGKISGERSKLIATIDAVHGPSPSEQESMTASLINTMRGRMVRAEARVEELEAGPPVPEACRGLVQAYREDRTRAGRELTRLEQALLVGSVRDVWGGPEFGGDWVDAELVNVTPEMAKAGYVELERLGYFDGMHLLYRGVRLAVVLMDQKLAAAGVRGKET